MARQIVHSTLSGHVFDGTSFSHPRRVIMFDLQDGESTEVSGSTSRPYVLKNVGGVYSCSCPAWRNQSLPIERRTCKHLRQLRGDAAESARIGGSLTEPLTAKPTQARPPALLLAENWVGELDPTGWLLSEKLDGVRAYWTGRQFLSRQGNLYWAPSWFTVGLPDFPLDGELWLGRKRFQRTVSIVRRHDEPSSWREIRFVIFDAPQTAGPFECRLESIDRLFDRDGPHYAWRHPHERCTGRNHLLRVLDHIESSGGEGVMLRQASSAYEVGRSATLLKVKRFRDAEATVVGHEPGRGRHKGRLGALLVRLSSGIRFAVGSGLSDAERSAPPSIGCTITFRYQDLTDAGVPRFPVFIRVSE
jgi:DNA ligase